MKIFFLTITLSFLSTFNLTAEVTHDTVMEVENFIHKFVNASSNDESIAKYIHSSISEKARVLKEFDKTHSPQMLEKITHKDLEEVLQLRETNSYGKDKLD